MEVVKTQRVDALYARQSIDKADSISIESQLDFCRYETRGAPCLEFSDKGYSGKDMDRPGFQQMLDSIRQGRIKRVICYKLDRCSRSILDFSTLMEQLQCYDVEFVSCTEKFDTSTPMGRAMLSICIVFAQLERETIQQRVSDAYHARCRKGFYMGGRVPFGYALEPYILDGKQTARYRIQEAEAQILRFLYREYAIPGTSLSDLTERLHKAGIKHPRKENGQWIRENIGRMLRNPIYVRSDERIFQYFSRQGIEIYNCPEDFIGTNGCYLYSEKDKKRKLLVLAPHEGIVEADLWLKCRSKKLYLSMN